MSSDTHYTAQLHDLLNDRLSRPERERVQEHLQTCESCREEWTRLRGTRELLRRDAEPAEVPPSLRDRIEDALAREDRRRFFHGRPSRLALGAAAAAVLVLTVVLVQQRRSYDFPDAAITDYQSIATKELPLELETSNTTEMERWFAERLEFPTRVFDLGMMEYQLIGGRIDALGENRSALFAYRHTRGTVVVCEMYPGQVADLPAGAERREHEGIDFFIYRKGKATAVFWQEGSIVCVLASEAPPEEMIALAYAKAMKVPAT